MEQVNQFSNNKLFFHKERLKKVLENQMTEPVVYELSLSGICNCKCTYCCCKNYHDHQMLTKRDIDILVQELKRNQALAVTLTGGGEPFTNENITYCIEELKKNNISVGIITNGLLLGVNHMSAIVKCASFIRISLDTVDSQTYRKLRGITIDFEMLKKQLQLLSNEKKRENTNVQIGTQIVYMEQSLRDVENTILFSKEAGCDFIQIRPVDNIPKMSVDRNYHFYLQNRDFLRKLKEKYSDENFKVFINEKFDEYYAEDVTKKYSRCLGGNFTTAIGHDMNLYFCCAHIGDPNFIIGNLRETSLQELLFSEKRKLFIENLHSETCQVQCRNHKINKLLQELSGMYPEEQNTVILNKSQGKIPLHVEFL